MRTTKIILLLIIDLFLGLKVNAFQQAQDTNSLNLSRQVVPFNQDWQFKKATYKTNIAIAGSEWENVTVPHTWNNKDIQKGKNFYTGDAFYRKDLVARQEWKDKRVFIRFEGVGTVADVYVNNKLAGTHKGAYSAFCFEISNLLRYDTTNIVLVKVNNEERPDIIPINNKLFGVYGGIYRPVSLIVTSKINITTTDYASAGIYIKQDVNNKKAAISVTAKIENKERQVQQIIVKTTIRDKSGIIVKQVQQQQDVQPQGINIVDQQLQLNNPHLWNGRKDPYLYSLTTAVIKDGKKIDEVTQPLGLRYFSIVSGKGFYLNGQPYRLYGVCRHQEWQDYGSALSNAQHKSDLDMIYEIGATSIRFAHYQQAEYIYAKCDS
ncbi:glycoside hydrolase family 2 protein, partial [Mucilaginibacter sp.]|uniref:glycoside hydrolase family 2 protein n=1 Tax=Mucilaginibacter sp. TaxID=1882438 RepID=UPI002ED5BDFE